MHVNQISEGITTKDSFLSSNHVSNELCIQNQVFMMHLQLSKEFKNMFEFFSCDRKIEEKLKIIYSIMCIKIKPEVMRSHHLTNSPSRESCAIL